MCSVVIMKNKNDQTEPTFDLFFAVAGPNRDTVVSVDAYMLANMRKMSAHTKYNAVVILVGL